MNIEKAFSMTWKGSKVGLLVDVCCYWHTHFIAFSYHAKDLFINMDPTLFYATSLEDFFSLPSFED